MERARRNLRVSARHRFQHGVVDEDVLVFRLDHVVALRPEARHVTVHVDRVLVAQAFQHRVDDDEGARPTHSGAAVDHHGTRLHGIQRPHPLQELEERSRMVWNTVIRPRCELQLLDFSVLRRSCNNTNQLINSSIKSVISSSINSGIKSIINFSSNFSSNSSINFLFHNSCCCCLRVMIAINGCT